MYPISASVTSSSWSKVTSCIPLFVFMICLSVSKVTPLKFFTEVLINYLYTPYTNLSSSSRVFTVSMDLPKHRKKSDIFICNISGYNDTYLSLISLGYMTISRYVIRLCGLTLQSMEFCGIIPGVVFWVVRHYWSLG